MTKKVNTTQVIKDMSQLNDGAGVRFTILAVLPKECRTPKDERLERPTKKAIEPTVDRPHPDKDIQDYTPREMRALQQWIKYDKEYSNYKDKETEYEKSVSSHAEKLLKQQEELRPITSAMAANQPCNVFIRSDTDKEGNRFACVWVNQKTLPLTGYSEGREPGAQRQFVEAIIEEMRIRPPEGENTNGAVCTAYIEHITHSRVLLNLVISDKEKQKRIEKDTVKQEAQDSVPETKVLA